MTPIFRGPRWSCKPLTRSWLSILLWGLFSCASSGSAVQEKPRPSLPHKRETSLSELLNAALSVTSSGDLAGAIKAWDRVLERKPTHIEALYNRGRALQKLGRFEEAKQSYQKILAREPDDKRTVLNLGITLHELNATQEGIRLYRGALKKHLFDADLLVNLAFLYRHNKQYKKAGDVLQQVLMRDRNNVDALQRLGALRRTEGRLPEAVTLLQRARQIAKERGLKRAGLSVELGLVRLAAQDDAGAMLAFDAALEEEPDHAWAHYNRGLLALRHQDFVLAALSLLKAKGHWPEDAQVVGFLGSAYHGQGKFVDASRHFKNAQDILRKQGRPRDPKLLYQLVVVSQEMGAVDEALGYAKKYQDLKGIRCGSDDYEGFCGRLNGIRLMKKMAK